jgi:hypothetical protein
MKREEIYRDGGPCVSRHGGTCVASVRGLWWWDVLIMKHSGCRHTSLAFGLIGDETRESFDFLAIGVKELKDRIGVRDPAVIVTDRDEQMRGAFKVFPEAQQLICRFHMNGNIKLQSRKKVKWPKPARSAEEGEAEDLRDV